MAAMRFRTIVCLWLASAATARASDATTPTAGPTQKPTVRLTIGMCADETWYHLNRGPDFDCAWVAQKPDTRCAVNGVVTPSVGAVVVARDACVAACGGCSPDAAGLSAPRPTALNDTSIRTAVALWFSDRNEAIETYGDISSWKTGEVTDMSGLFEDASSFNDDISPWDTSGVTTMNGMFSKTSSFNQPIGAWDTSGVRRMDWMFVGSAFNQPIGD